jgi:hypothetical protein
MKITALLVLKCNPEGSDPVILANAMDVSHFGYFQRSSVKEFIFFVGRTVAKRTPPGQRQSVQHEGRFQYILSLILFFLRSQCLSSPFLVQLYIELEVYFFLKKKKKQNLDWCIDPVLMSNCVISVVSVVIFGILWSR